MENCAYLRKNPGYAPDINTMWEKIGIAYTQTSETCLGRQQKKRKEWMTADHSRIGEP